ncbi:hypothetical protein LK07_04010 [Streptomyces pluripotens]|uniref:Right handed beta helix domain-containing protein n=1 Tax=Streptomyces pluripotens TaxID=1355015 RepID=A0A221NTM0_9ACTN|nr:MULTISPECIES: hypothetical protein [Streptomyces]ARP69073.1 hypothetical protein LK06_002920 [Streptomyces pluripotens]ASN23333.1 hypothetical protein LK07_04010 [Streptomyces pluripotens]KIE25607.1 hypothetical protein LK08_17935 [Streptomyces sp. MUSC 125]MCH0558981.1 hypothetical protein [Streptomyces sp. MUM 16J]
MNLQRSTRAATVGAALAAISLFTAPTPAHAATIAAACNANPITAGTNLKNAIASAATGDTVTLVDYCIYAFNDSNVPAADESALTIDKTLTIDTVSGANTATIRRITTAHDFRIINITTGEGGPGNLTLNHTTVQFGSTLAGGEGGGIRLETTGTMLRTNNATVEGNKASRRGGGIFAVLNSGSVELNNTLVRDNATDTNDGGGMYTNAATTDVNGSTFSENRARTGGGGIYVANAATMLMVHNSTFKNNTSEDGGGLLVNGGAMNMDHTVITNNLASRPGVGGAGGGLMIGLGFPANITDSQITGNKATGNGANGGGLNVTTAGASNESLRVENTDISGNETIGAGGRGGGVMIFGVSASRMLDFENSTISGNRAAGDNSSGAGLYRNDAGTTTLGNVSITDNTASGTGSQVGGLYNVGFGGNSVLAFTGVSITDNTAPAAPAPGGLYTDTAVTDNGGNSVTGNSPTNCTYSPVVPGFCTNLP